MSRNVFAALALIGCAGSQTTEVEAPPPAPVEAPAPAPTVSPVPEGFHTLTPTLIVSDLPAAVAFYEKALGATSQYLMDGPDGKPMHAEIKLGDAVVMLEPEAPERGQKAPTTLNGTNGSLHVYVEDVDAVQKAAIEAGAKETMPDADMWWGDRFAEVVDPYGHRWSLGTHIEDVPSDVMKTRAEAAIAAMTAGKEYTWEKGAAAASYKPEGYQTVTPSLVVKGGTDAVDFYSKALGGEVVSSVPLPDGGLMHAELKVGDSMLMLGGAMPQMDDYSKAAVDLGGSPVQVMMYVPDTDAALSGATAAGATQVMAAKDMFWGDRYASVTDPSGTVWAVATHIEDVPPEQIKERMLKQLGAPEGAEAPDGAAPAEDAEEGEGDGDEGAED
ncbi:MAG: VOC family protein [Myxococcota bacterium]